MGSSNWGAEDGGRAYSGRMDREQQRKEAIRQAGAAKAAGRGKRRV